MLHTKPHTVETIYRPTNKTKCSSDSLPKLKTIKISRCTPSDAVNYCCNVLHLRCLRGSDYASEYILYVISW